MLEGLLAPFAEQLQRNTEASVGRLRARNGLKEEIHRRAAIHCGQLCGDVREATGLGRHAIGVDEPRQRAQDGIHCFDRIRRRIHADNSVAAAIEKPFECGEKNSANVIHRVIRLNSNAQHAALAHCVPATRHISNLRSSKDQVLVAHDLGNGRRDFGENGPLKLFQLFFGGSVVENEFPEFTDGYALDLLKPLGVKRFEKQAADFVISWVDDRLAGNFAEG
jgi:hypothetical protein